MATPLNRLQSSFRTGTQLGRTSLEEASARAGQAVRPTTPVGAAEMGVGPDSAKMAGSSANVAAAQRQALQPAETERLQDVLRRRTLAREETAEERAARGRGAQLGGLTSLQTRVQELMQQQLNSAKRASEVLSAPRITADDILQKRPELPRASAERLATILQDLSVKQSTAAQVAEAYEILGITGTEEATVAVLQDLIPKAGQQIGEAAAEGISDALLITEPALNQMGYTSEELAPLLGMTAEQLLTLTTGELVARVNSVQRESYSRVEALRKVVNDPNVGAAERQAAQEQLTALGYAGVSASEASVQRINDLIQDANTVEIAGQEISVSDALSDKFISSMIKEYIDNPTGDIAQDMIENYPGLVSFIEDNKDDLKAHTDKMTENVTDFIQLQADVAAQRVSRSGTNIDSSYFPDHEGFHTDVPKMSAIVEHANERDYTGQVTTSMNRIAAISSDGVDSLKEASDEELMESGFYDNSEVYSDYVETLVKLSSDGTQQGILESIFGDMALEDFKALNEEIKKARHYEAAGLLSDLDPIIDLLDSDGDGTLDSPDQLKASFLSQYSTDGKPITIKDLLASGRKVDSLDMNSLRNSLTEIRRNIKGEGSDLITKFGQYFEDGKLDEDEIEKLKSEKLEDLQALSDSGLNIGAASVADAIESAATKVWEDLGINEKTEDIRRKILSATETNPYVILDKEEDIFTDFDTVMAEYENQTHPKVKLKIKQPLLAEMNRVQDALISATNKQLQGAESGWLNKLAPGGNIANIPEDKRRTWVLIASQTQQGRTKTAALDWLRAYDRQKNVNNKINALKAKFD